MVITLDFTFQSSPVKLEESFVSSVRLLHSPFILKQLRLFLMIIQENRHERIKLGTLG